MEPRFGCEARADDRHANVITSERRQLINLAYRLLGSLNDAEDAVQEASARWYALSRAQQDAVTNPGAWLHTVTSRICLDLLGSARVRRERYVGEWVPEPLPNPSERAAGDPVEQITLDESVSMAFLVVLESTSPAERVSFILHDVFGYSFAEVAEIVGRTPAACRQLASAARRRFRTTSADRAPEERHVAMVGAFKRAWESADIDRLVELLADDASAIGDGGGVIRAELRPVVGAQGVARFFAERMTASELAIEESTVNGQPGLVARLRGRVVSVLSFGIENGRIVTIWATLNPEKLRPWLQ